MAVDIAIIKKAIDPLPSMFKDIYIGNGEPPLRDTCREYLAEKKCKETARTEAIKEKKDDNKWGKRLLIGAIVGVLITQSGLIVFAYIKLLPFFEIIR